MAAPALRLELISRVGAYSAAELGDVEDSLFRIA